MDITQLRKFVVRRLIQTANEWNKETGAFPVKPEGMTPNKEALWLLATGNTRIGSLSELQSSGLREMVMETFGIEMRAEALKMKGVKTPPYLCLCVAKEDGVRGAEHNVLVCRRASGGWSTETGGQFSMDDRVAPEFRLPTLEDAERFVAGLKDEAVYRFFSGLIPVVKTPQIFEELKTAIVENTNKFFESQPKRPDMDEFLYTAYELSLSTDTDAARLAFHLAGKSFDEAQREEVRKYSNDSQVSLKSTLVAYRSEKTVYVTAGDVHNLTKKGYEERGSTSSWSQIQKPTDDEIEKVVKGLPARYAILYLPPARYAEIMASVELPKEEEVETHDD